MSKKIGFSANADAKVVQRGRFHYPLVLREGEWKGIFSMRTRTQHRCSQNSDAVDFTSFWFNWYSHPGDKPRYYLAPDTSEQDCLISRPDPYRHGK